MTDNFQKDKFDAYMKLAEIRLSRHKTRADVEWKISLALWALMAAAPISLKDTPQTTTHLYVIGIILAVVVLAKLFLWTAQIWVRNRDDQDNAFFYIENAEALLTAGANAPREKPKSDFRLFSRSNLKTLFSLKNWGVWFQTLATVLIAAAVFWVFALRLPA